MPLYGTRAFQDQTLTMYIRKSFIEKAPFGAFVTAASHELSHVVLKAVNSPLYSREEAVDLTAMLLGYRHFFLRDSQYESIKELPAEPQSWWEDVIGYLTSRARIPEADIAVTSHFLGYLSHEERKYANWIMENWPK